MTISRPQPGPVALDWCCHFTFPYHCPVPSVHVQPYRDSFSLMSTTLGSHRHHVITANLLAQSFSPLSFFTTSVPHYHHPVSSHIVTLVVLERNEYKYAYTIVTGSVYHLTSCRVLSPSLLLFSASSVRAFVRAVTCSLSSFSCDHHPKDKSIVINATVGFPRVSEY